MKQRLTLLLFLFLLLTISGCKQDAPVPETRLPPLEAAATETFSAAEAPAAETTVPETTVSDTAPTETTQPSTTPPLETFADGQPYVEFFREGIVSQVAVEIAQGSQGNYTIAYNPEAFAHEGDTFRYLRWDTAPSVYYCVQFFPDMTAQEVIDGLMLQYDGGFDNTTQEDTTVGNYYATGLYFSNTHGKMVQLNFFVVGHLSGCYLIETQFVAEMFEGLYPQMRALFDTFQILP